MMAKHLLKMADYHENEAFIYCPVMRAFGSVTASFPLRCPLCGKIFRDRLDKGIKKVLEYPQLLSKP